MSKKSATEVKKRIYPAKMFARGAMVCPSCRYLLEDSYEACPKCQFSGHAAVEKFPFPPPALEPVLDPGKVLTPQEAGEIRKKVLKARKRLPQVHFLNCIVPLGDEVDLREFGFWLFNGGQYQEGEAAKSFAILLLIDPTSRQLSVSAGYGLEVMMTDSDWVQICESCKGLLAREKYAAGIELFIQKATEAMIVRALEVRKELKRK